MHGKQCMTARDNKAVGLQEVIALFILLGRVLQEQKTISIYSGKKDEMENENDKIIREAII